MKDNSNKASQSESEKYSRSVALFLVIFPYTGLFGIHDFYFGKVALGIFKFFTVNFFAFGWFIDIVLMCKGKYKLSDGSYFTGKAEAAPKAPVKPAVTTKPAAKKTVKKTEMLSDEKPVKKTDPSPVEKTDPETVNAFDEKNDVADSKDTAVEQGGEAVPQEKETRPYLWLRIKDTDSCTECREIGYSKEEGEKEFYVDFDNGTIYIVWKDDPKDIIGYYDTTLDGLYYKVYDKTKSRIIGEVGGELINFRKREADSSVGRYLAEQECLAYYSSSGSIHTNIDFDKYGLLKTVGIISGVVNGDESALIGGSAAFVAIFYAYDFQCMFRDYFAMETEEFYKKHPKTNPFE